MLLLLARLAKTPALLLLCRCYASYCHCPHSGAIRRVQSDGFVFSGEEWREFLRRRWSCLPWVKPFLLSCDVCSPLGGFSFACKRWASAAIPRCLCSCTLLSGVTSLQATIRIRNQATAESTKQPSWGGVLSEKSIYKVDLFFFN